MPPNRTTTVSALVAEPATTTPKRVRNPNAENLAAEGFTPEQVELILELRRKRGTSTSTPTVSEPVEEKGNFLGNLAKGIVRPVATLAARPFQLGAQLAGATPEQVNKVNLGGLIAPVPENARDVLKDVGRGVETVALGIGGGGAVQAAKTGFKGAVSQAAKLGAKQGAKAGAIGGAGLSLEEGNINPLEVAKDAAIGAATGGALGGIIGPTASLLRPSPNAARNAALQITKPVLSKADRIRAISEGRAQTVGNTPFTRRVEISKPSNKEIEVAEAVKDIVRTGYKPERNIQEIHKTVSKIDDELTGYLDENNAIFNKNQLRARLNTAKEKSRVIFSGDQVLENRYNAIIEELENNLQKGDVSSLFRARKAFDQTVRAKFPRSFDGNPSDNVTKNAILDVRREVNEYIASLLPEGNQFKAQLRKEHLMLEAIENIAEKAEQLVKTSAGRKYLNAVLTGAGITALTGYGYSAVAGGR